MIEAMAHAELGDDVYHSDPTVNELERLGASLLGHSDAVYMPTGTMSNLSAVLAAAERGSEVIAEAGSHIVYYEAGGMAAVAGTMPRATIAAEWSYDPLAGGWPADLLAGLGLSVLLDGWDIPKLPAGAVAGCLAPEAAARTRLPPGLLVVQGLMDSYAAALAADVYQPGRVAVSIGTSSSYLGLSERPVHDPRLLGPVPDALGPGTIAQQGGQTSAAAAAEWFSRQLAPGVPLADLDAEAAASSLWMQIHADVLGRPLLRLPAVQPVTLGAAICGAVGAGAYPDLPAAAAAMTAVRPGWIPDPDRHRAYGPLYASYLHRLAAVSSLDGHVPTRADARGAHNY
jgi:ribulose kinase